MFKRKMFKRKQMSEAMMQFITKEKTIKGTTLFFYLIKDNQGLFCMGYTTDSPELVLDNTREHSGELKWFAKKGFNNPQDLANWFREDNGEAFKEMHRILIEE